MTAMSGIFIIKERIYFLMEDKEFLKCKIGDIVIVFYDSITTLTKVITSDGHLGFTYLKPKDFKTFLEQIT